MSSNRLSRIDKSVEIGIKIIQNESEHTMKIRVYVVLILLSFSMVPAEAAMTIDAYHEAKKSDDTKWFKGYIGGIGQGISVSNASLKIDRKPVMFCLPGDKIFDADDYIHLIDGYLDKNSDKLERDFQINMVLLLALKEAFPCNARYKKRMLSN